MPDQEIGCTLDQPKVLVNNDVSGDHIAALLVGNVHRLDLQRFDKTYSREYKDIAVGVDIKLDYEP